MTPTSDWLVWLTVLLPFAGFLANGALSFFRPEAKRAVGAIGVGVLVVAFLIALVVVAKLAGASSSSPVVLTAWEWMSVGVLHIDVALQVDQLSAVMLLVVTGVGMLIHIFSVGYMRADPGYARYFAYLNLFIFFMLVLVLGANFPIMFVGWEGVGPAIASGSHV